MEEIKNEFSIMRNDLTIVFPRGANRYDLIQHFDEKIYSVNLIAGNQTITLCVYRDVQTANEALEGIAKAIKDGSEGYAMPHSDLQAIEIFDAMNGTVTFATQDSE